MNDYNAAEREHVKAATKAAKIAEIQRREVIVQLMTTVPGRAWMLERLERCHVFATSFNGEALASAFAEGQRNIGLQDLNDIMWACPDQYVVMLRERNERSSANAAAAEHIRSQDGVGGTETGDLND